MGCVELYSHTFALAACWSRVELHGAQAHGPRTTSTGALMPRVKDTDRPDAFIWRDERGGWVWLCSKCTHRPSRAHAELGYAWSAVTDHLWSVHSLRRAWVDRYNPEHIAAVQTALPLVLAHNTTRH